MGRSDHRRAGLWLREGLEDKVIDRGGKTTSVAGTIEATITDNVQWRRKHKVLK